jgi:hypothetical protein
MARLSLRVKGLWNVVTSVSEHQLLHVDASQSCGMGCHFVMEYSGLRLG